MSGVGKTTLAKRLSQDLGIPCLPKNDIKEFLFDTLGIRDDEEWAKLLGRTSAAMLYEVANELLSANQSLIIENTFPSAYAPQDIEKVLHTQRAKALEIFCYADEAVRIERVRNRINSDERHAVHVAQDMKYLQSNLEVNTITELNIGELIRFDTTFADDKAYAKLLTQIQEFLAQD